MPGSQQANRLVAIDPLQYPDWDSLLARHPQNCFFHGTAWARVLYETYGHRPFYFCRFSNGQLEEMLPVMEVSSPLTGRRGVSLPFTDFCSPLPSGNNDQKGIYSVAMDYGRENHWRYLECRSGNRSWPGATPSMTFYGHVIDLNQVSESLFKNFDESVRRGVRKAEKAGVQIEFSDNLESIQTFYSLHCQTRHRHGLPPQPFRFFKNICKHVLAEGRGFVATARLGHQPVAASVFFHDQRQSLYKFGASAYSFQHLRPNNLLMWAAIKQCAGRGFEYLHLGRTSLANDGLRRFKLGFGAREEKIEYFKYDFVKQSFVTDVDRAESWVNRIFRCLPMPLLRLAGQMLYPHLS